jgi:hypothetical protein
MLRSSRSEVVVHAANKLGPLENRVYLYPETLDRLNVNLDVNRLLSTCMHLTHLLFAWSPEL